MKRVIVIVVILLSTSILFAQKDTAFYKHEIRVSLGEMVPYVRFDGVKYTNISFNYFYRPVKSFWVGVNFVNYFGEKIYYDWREYSFDGNFKDFSESKMKYCAILAPEIRFSCVNRKAVILYGGFSAGIGIENGFDTRTQKYPEIFPSVHITLLGVSANLGKNSNVVIGGELGFGFKGLISAHAGYRF